MNHQQYAVRSRVALCQKWPELLRYDQGVMLQVLSDSFTATEQIEGEQCRKKVRGQDTFPPSFEDVTAFLAELQSDLQAQDFLDFYNANGWMAGRVKMKDWRSAARRAHRLWQRPQAGAVKWGAVPKPAKLTEWERKQKMERLKALELEFHNLRYPGGSAYPVFLAGARAKEAAALLEKITILKEELK